MITSAKQYLIDAVKEYRSVAGVSSLAYVPTPSIDDRFDKESAFPGALARNAASLLMKLSAARLFMGDILVSTTFLARRISRSFAHEDRHLKTTYVLLLASCRQGTGPRNSY